MPYWGHVLFAPYGAITPIDRATDNKELYIFLFVITDLSLSC